MWKNLSLLIRKIEHMCFQWSILVGISYQTQWHLSNKCSLPVTYSTVVHVCSSCNYSNEFAVKKYNSAIILHTFMAEGRCWGMGSPSSPTLDEAHCLWPLCSHACCWEAERRIREGRPRQLKVDTTIRAWAAASEGGQPLTLLLPSN